MASETHMYTHTRILSGVGAHTVVGPPQLAVGSPHFQPHEAVPSSPSGPPTPGGPTFPTKSQARWLQCGGYFYRVSLGWVCPSQPVQGASESKMQGLGWGLTPG